MHRFLLLFALSACAHSSFLPLEMTTLPGREKYPGAHVVQLLDEQTLRFQADPKTHEPIVETDSHWQTRLLKGRMPEAAAFQYSRTFSKITSLESRVVLPDGSSHDADPEKRRDVPAIRASELFSDARMVSIEMPEVPVGGVRETRVVEQYTDVQVWMFPFTFGSTEPTEIARLIVEAPKGWEVEIVTRGTVARRNEDAGAISRTILEATAVPAFFEEPNGPPAYRVMPRAFVRLKAWETPAGRQRAFATDQALSAWLDQRYLAVSPVTPELKATVAEVLKSAGSKPEEKARALYEYVAKSVEYCAIEIGYGGWIPHAPADVNKVRYGDCKDKANYLHLMLGEAGVDSHVSMVHSHSGFPNEFMLPTLTGTFNHAIVAITLPEGQVFADPTERTVPFGLLPARDCESPALLLSPAGEKLTHTPSFGPERSTELQRFTLKIDENGKGGGHFLIASTGVNAAELKYDLLRGKKKKEELVERWLNLKSLHVSAITQTLTEDFADQATVEGELDAERLISRPSGGVTLIRLDEFAPRWLPSLSDDRRLTPFAFRWRHTLVGEFTISLPRSAHATALPAPLVFDDRFLHYELSWTHANDQVSVRRQLVIKQRVIAPEEFNAFRAAIEQVQQAEARAVVLRYDAVTAR